MDVSSDIHKELRTKGRKGEESNKSKIKKSNSNNHIPKPQGEAGRKNGYNLIPEMQLEDRRGKYLRIRASIFIILLIIRKIPRP